MNKNKIKILDKYVLTQVVEIFILGVAIFSSIVFASQAFLELVKQITDFGVQPRIALMVIILNLPAVIVMTIPMSMLLATIMGINKLCLSSEITVMRSCGIGINRIARPIFAFAILMSLLSFAINEFIVPFTMSQSKTLLVWAVGQKNIPDGKKNYILKENMNDGFTIKRFFYVQNCTKKELENISVIDFSEDEKTQIIQASKGETADEGWIFKNASFYTINDNNNLMNTSWMAKTTVDFGISADESLSKTKAEEMNFTQLRRYIREAKAKALFGSEKEENSFKIQLHEKLAIPFTTIIFTLLGVPLAITPPRVRYNRGFLFSILIILFLYVIKALAASMGETGTIPPFLAAWMPNIVFGILGYIIYYKKVYKI